MWYSLSFDREHGSIVIRIDPRIVEWIEQNIEGNLSAVQFYGKRCQDEFIFFDDDKFGFGGVASVGRDYGWLKLDFSLAQASERSKQGNLWMTFSLLFNLILPCFAMDNIHKVADLENVLQLVIMGNIGCEVGRGRAGFSVEFSPKMARITNQLSETALGRVADAMQSVDTLVYSGGSKAGRSGSRFQVHKRGDDNSPAFILSVPGDGCWLAGRLNADEQGASLDPHNVDSFGQMACYLAGICCLHDIVLEASV